jgi:hypothetical protein
MSKPKLTIDLEEVRIAFEAKFQREGIIQKRLMDEGMDLMNAVVRASDIVSAEDATARAENGEDPDELVGYVGSYARLDWAIKHLPRPRLLERLPGLWVGSDPDDTCPEYLALWQEAYVANGRRVVQDEEETSLPDTPFFTVYRGQVGNEKRWLGVSWTLDRRVAERFAASGGGRGLVKGGKVLEARIYPSAVLAFLTSRDESELILDLSKVEVK